MTAKLSERLKRRATIMSDTAMMKTQFPEWLLKELEDAAIDLGESAELARRVEDAPVADLIVMHGDGALYACDAVDRQRIALLENCTVRVVREG